MLSPEPADQFSQHMNHNCLKFVPLVSSVAKLIRKQIQTLKLEHVVCLLIKARSQLLTAVTLHLQTTISHHKPHPQSARMYTCALTWLASIRTLCNEEFNIEQDFGISKISMQSIWDFSLVARPSNLLPTWACLSCATAVHRTPLWRRLLLRMAFSLQNERSNGQTSDVLLLEYLYFVLCTSYIKYVCISYFVITKTNSFHR